MSDYITRSCPICGIEYQADPQRLKHNRQTTCSRECSYALRAKLHSNHIVIPCACCGKDVEKTPSHPRKSFCSRECHDNYRLKGLPRKGRVCATCGTVFNAKNPTQTHCSRKCFEVDHKVDMAGENNPSYIDGRSYKRTYNAGESWQETRLKVYKRDRYCCRLCGVKCISKRDATKETAKLIIQCHHLTLYRKTQDNSLDNLITVCLHCHGVIHGKLIQKERHSAILRRQKRLNKANTKQLSLFA